MYSIISELTLSKDSLDYIIYSTYVIKVIGDILDFNDGYLSLI